ncbi:MAG: hypothetical protein PHD76_08675 [Methylacidiphilales bacterium]|nr:hypothetical protein [Candidatus Methylacidiphilales bacterium]
MKSLDQWPYFCWGCVLIAVKYNLDRAIAWFGFHHTWYFWNYIKPHGFARIDAIPPNEQAFYVVLLLTALPFLILGIVLTLRRLRSAGLPTGLCLLFFVPLINLLFFATLSLLPAKQAASPQPGKSTWISWLPISAVGSALASMAIVGLTGVGLAYFSIKALGTYGWGLFVALPFAMGLVSVLIYAGREKRSFASCMLVAILPILFAGLCLFVMAVEGIICLIMATPIGLALAFFGGIVGYFILRSRTMPLNSTYMMLVLAAAIATMGMEKQADEAPPLLSVTTSLVIDAPPEKVWPNVISFSPIPSERDWILHTGVAYPTQARIVGHGVGAVRHCIFTTGEFIEPIEVWDAPHRLRFSVADQPEPMVELSPYPRLETPHLHGYLQSHEGELRLTAMPGGKTLLEGTTWYTDRIWPNHYWQVWSDLMIHHIHLRVLNHIKNLSEQNSSEALH